MHVVIRQIYQRKSASFRSRERGIDGRPECQLEPSRSVSDYLMSSKSVLGLVVAIHRVLQLKSASASRRVLAADGNLAKRRQRALERALSPDVSTQSPDGCQSLD